MKYIKAGIFRFAPSQPIRHVNIWYVMKLKVLLIVSAAISVFAPLCHGQSDKNPDPGARLIQVVMGKTIFTVPQEFYLPMRSGQGISPSLRVYATLPDVATVIKRDKGKAKDYLTLNVFPYNPAAAFHTHAEHLAWLINGGYIAPSSEVDNNRLEKFLITKPSGLYRYYWVGKKAGNEIVVIKCHEIGLAPNPLCVVRYTVGDQYSIHYYFSRDYLEHWQQIDDRIGQLLNRDFVRR